jgi:diguanylate cyclase
MKALSEKSEQNPDFLVSSTLGVALTTLILLAPFGINNFYQGRILLGIGSSIIVLLCAINAWYCHRGSYYPSINFYGLAPAIIFILIFVYRQQGVIGTYWSYPAVVTFYFMLPERKAWIANALLLAIVLPLAWQVLDDSVVLRFVISLLAVSIFSAIFVRVITKQHLKLKSIAATDSLTGLFNRTLLQDTLEYAVHQSDRMKAPMTMMVLDLDHFKAINDSLGHEAGDSVLRGVGELLKKRIRGSDKIFRIGGEEFLVLLSNTDSNGGQRIAEELRSAMESQSLLSDRTVTVSIGVASLHSGENWKQWMKRCDEKLYRAKMNGRNQVVI